MRARSPRSSATGASGSGVGTTGAGNTAIGPLSIALPVGTTSAGRVTSRLIASAP